MQRQIVGLPWYKPENFLKVKSTFVDEDTFKPSYSEWLVGAQRAYDRLVAERIHVIKVDIDPIAFPRWCVENSMRQDCTARLRYAAVIAQRYVEMEPTDGNRTSSTSR